ncbi:hypothetical protein Pcinc_032441 [Petrolisthes cinctipes]|uniref:CCHC-type domain-containing protein n=1 Tax=Petrolisthes cinctipes TaxID=88211 RepID=A0AAE1EUJ5_PETCI|nr:hypothetical protein Pcinc_032441 [Petrolisthes cinctipes]
MKRGREHGSSLSPRHPAGQGNSIYNRPAKQHRPPAPPKGRGEEPVCSYCSRRGHTIKDCKTRAAEQRQEHLLRRVIAEVRQPIPSFPPPPPGFSHIVPQPPMWGQTPGWQWTSNLPYLSNQANQHQLRADWSSLRRDLQRTDWGAILTGSADAKARAFTERLKASQHQHVPHRQYTSRPTDQPWFGTSRMWNVFTAAAPSMQDLSIQQVKVAAHRWRGTLPTPIRHI